MTGASRSQKQCWAACAAISEPKPPNWTASCARTMTGLSPRIAAESRPLASNGVDGIATTRPGMCAKSASRLCECCAPRRTPPPETIRITSGMLGVPPIMNRSFAAWFMIWSKATPAKSENCSSTTGRSPDPAPDDPRRGRGRVGIPPPAVAVVEPFGCAEETADLADVLADQDHVRIRLQLEVERLAHGRDEA